MIERYGIYPNIKRSLLFNSTYPYLFATHIIWVSLYDIFHLVHVNAGFCTVIVQRIEIISFKSTNKPGYFLSTLKYLIVTTIT